MSNTVKVITTLILLNLYNVSSNSYIPTYIEGTPITGSITGNAPPDIRGKPLFRIEHKVWLPYNSSHFHFYLTAFLDVIWVPHYTSSRIPNPQFQPTRTSIIFCLFVASFVKSELGVRNTMWWKAQYLWIMISPLIFMYLGYIFR